MHNTAIDPLSQTSGPAPAIGFRSSATINDKHVDPRVAQAIARAKAGDREAIRFLYIQYKDNVYGYVLSFVRDPHEAEDVTQYVFLKLMSVIQKYQSREVPFTSWLLRVARNTALDHLRQRRVIPCEDVYDTSYESDTAAIDRRWGLEQALEALPEEQRNVVVLRHLVGLTPGEIAECMGRTEASIHGLHHRARKTVQRELIQAECMPAARHSR